MDDQTPGDQQVASPWSPPALRRLSSRSAVAMTSTGVSGFDGTTFYETS